MIREHFPRSSLSPNTKESMRRHQSLPMRATPGICHPIREWRLVQFSILLPLKIQAAGRIMEVLYQGSYLLYIIKYLRRMDGKDQQTEANSLVWPSLLFSSHSAHQSEGRQPSVRADTYQEKKRDLQIIHFHILPEKENIFWMVWEEILRDSSSW